MDSPVVNVKIIDIYQNVLNMGLMKIVSLSWETGWNAFNIFGNRLNTSFLFIVFLERLL